MHTQQTLQTQDTDPSHEVLDGRLDAQVEREKQHRYDRDPKTLQPTFLRIACVLRAAERCFNIYTNYV